MTYVLLLIFSLLRDGSYGTQVLNIPIFMAKNRVIVKNPYFMYYTIYVEGLKTNSCVNSNTKSG